MGLGFTSALAVLVKWKEHTVLNCVSLVFWTCSGNSRETRRECPAKGPFQMSSQLTLKATEAHKIASLQGWQT